MKIPPELDKLAKHVADTAVAEGTPFAETLDALKNLTAYYALLLKNEGKGGPDAGADEPTIAGMMKSFQEPDEEELANGRRKRRPLERMVPRTSS